jgi:hypothetical protein
MEIARMKPVSFLSALMSLTLSLSAHAAPINPINPIKPESLKFHWVANDGSFFHSCTHQLESAELNDWRVECGGRTFKVHFLVREVHRNVVPRTTLEVLYFISGSASSSQGVWINLDEDTPIHSLAFHQSVDSDSSDLVLNYRR